MAVEGKFGDQNIRLENAAEEATLSDLASTMKKTFGGSGSFNPKNVQALSKGAKDTSDSFQTLLKRASGAADALDELEEAAGKKAKDAFKEFARDVKYASGNFKSAFSSDTAEKGARNIIEGITDTLNGAIDAIGSMSANPYVKTASELAQAAVTGLGAAAAAAVGAIQGFSDQFKELANNGFIAGEGLGTLNNKILASGMTLGQFEKLVKDSGEDLRNIGGSASQGARQVLRLRKAMIGQEEQFQRLGYDFDELAPLVAEYAGNLARGASEINISDQQLIDQTASYAKNLRMVSDLTGQNAKQLKEESEAAATEARNQKYLIELERSGRAGASKTFGDISATLKQIAPGYDELFKDYNTQYGTALSTTTGILQSSNPAMAQILREMRDGIRDGTINQSNAQEILIQKIKDNQAGITAGMNTIATLAQAGVEGTERFGIMNRELNNIFATDLPALKKNIEDAGKNRDELTTSIVSLQEANQAVTQAQNEFAMALGKTGTDLGVIGAVNATASAFRSAAQTIKEVIGGDFSGERISAAEALGPVPEGGLMQATGTRGTTRGGRGGVSNVITYTEQERQQNALFNAYNKLSDQELANLGLVRHKKAGTGIFGSDYFGDTIIEKKMARGGIIPNMGVDGMSIRAGDGVSEAIVPLPDGRNIPVKLDDTAFRSMADKLDLLARLNGAMLNAMERNNSLTRQGQMLSS